MSTVYLSMMFKQKHKQALQFAKYDKIIVDNYDPAEIWTQSFLVGSQKQGYVPTNSLIKIQSMSK